jgi:hypothetical protein
VLEVRRYLRKKSVVDLTKTFNRYFLWSQHLSDFLLVSRDIEPNRDDFDWNYSDHLICGHYTDEVLDSMKQRRIRFVVAPAGKALVTGSGDAFTVVDSSSPEERAAVSSTLFNPLTLPPAFIFGYCF